MGGVGQVTEGPALAADRLTGRELEVLQLIAAGRSTREIAERLCLSPNTVLGYRKTLFAKLGVHSKIDAVVQGLRHGLIALPGEHGGLREADDAGSTESR